MIKKQMLPNGVQNMRDVELVPVYIEVADSRMTHVQDEASPVLCTPCYV